MSAQLDSPGGEQPVETLSPLSDQDIGILEQNDITTVSDFLNHTDDVQGFLRDEEFEDAVAEAETIVGGLSLTERARQEHSEFHDELVEAGHEPVTEIVSADDIKQPAGRPRRNLPIETRLENFDDSVVDEVRTVGYTTGSDLNAVSPAELATETSLDSETARRVIEECRTAYHGLPVLEDNGHPLIPDKETYREIWTRRTLSGAEDIVEVCYGAAENQYPICLVGYPGVGKSYLIAHICAMTNRPLISIDMDSSLRAEDLLGFHIPEDDQQVEFKYGIFPLAFRYGLWLNINELPAADAGVWLALHQMTERDPEIMLRSTGEKIEPHPAFRITGTRNPNTDAFSGHGQSNEASNSRWEEIWVDYLPQRAEVKLLDHMVNSSEQHVSKTQLENLVAWAEKFRPGVPDPEIDPDSSPESAVSFKQHVFQGVENRSRTPRLSTRELAQICFKSSRPGATLQRAAKAVVFHCAEPNKHNHETAMELASSLNA